MKRLLIALLALVVAACSSGGDTGNFTEPTDRLEVLSWWVSPSERPAFQSLVDAFTAANPQVSVIDNTISGGAGANMQVTLASRLVAKDLPDVWQTLVGTSVRGWADAGHIVDVSDIVTETGLANTMPQPLLDSLTAGGKQWGVPTGAHRGNNLWFNLHALARAGIAPPQAGYTADQFSADLRGAAGAGVTPLCLGAKDRFAAVELFENTLLSVIGADGWSRIAADKFDWSGPEVREALGRFADYVDHADPKARDLGWSEAAGKLARGECAFLVMNDSVYGELTAGHVTDGVDFGRAAFPGTDSYYIAIVDAFVAAKTARNGVNALKFLRTIADPATNLAFNRLKGSVPVRADVDTSSLPPYQRAASQALWHDTILLSMATAELGSPAFQQGLYDAVYAYLGSHNERAFIDTVQNSVTVPIAGR